MGNFLNELHAYKSVPRELVFDNSLTDRARFVYIFMACKPENWDFFIEPMAKEIGYSVDTLRKYVNELVTSGWLVKGTQSNENGHFGAVKYMLKATKFSVTEIFRDGNSSAQDNIDCKKDKIEKNKKENSEKDRELFEKCWLAYRRKGSKKESLVHWNKLTDVERQNVLPHIKAYVATRDLQYQKDFQRYLRDKIFQTVVVSGKNVAYDPTRLGKGESASNVYMPSGNFSLTWDDTIKAYLYIGYYMDGSGVPDGYTDDNRPDGATIVLNNGRGTIVWSSDEKRWNRTR